MRATNVGREATRVLTTRCGGASTMKRAGRQRQPSRGLIQEPDVRRVQLIAFEASGTLAVEAGVGDANETAALSVVMYHRPPRDRPIALLKVSDQGDIGADRERVVFGGAHHLPVLGPVKEGVTAFWCCCHRFRSASHKCAAAADGAVSAW
jgi:hypothetical protein